MVARQRRNPRVAARGAALRKEYVLTGLADAPDQTAVLNMAGYDQCPPQLRTASLITRGRWSLPRPPTAARSSRSSAMLIGLTGSSGSHKTAVAKRLEKAHGFTRIHAGRPVKNAVRAFGLTKAQTDGNLTVDEVMTATGWQRHTVRGMVSAALKKKLGLNIIKRNAAMSSHRRAIHLIGQEMIFSNYDELKATPSSSRSGGLAGSDR